MMSELVVVRDSGIHGKGGYAASDIPSGTRVIEYVGEIISREEGDRRFNAQLEQGRITGSGMVYVFEMDETHDLDGNVDNNPARFINHSCSPNCKVEITERHIWIIAARDIKKGEELSFNYGYDDLLNYRDHTCRCGSPRCVGYILDESIWPRIQQLPTPSPEISPHSSP